MRSRPEGASGSGVAFPARDFVTPTRAAARRQATPWTMQLPLVTQGVRQHGNEKSSARWRSIGSVGQRCSRHAPPASRACCANGDGGISCRLATWSDDLNLAVTNAVAQVASRRSIGSMGPPLSRRASATRHGLLAAGSPRDSSSPSSGGPDADQAAAAAAALAAVAATAAAAADLLTSAELDGDSCSGKDALKPETGSRQARHPPGMSCEGPCGFRHRVAPAVLDAARSGGPVKGRFDLFC
mmetsp:Transcript_87278/g.211731  ORF Transcript_87278/g.211731 Transcript_87278/m.211731 type:complete len:242 (+) Transcript_87278:1-726(+)